MVFVLVTGAPASGKSTMSRALAARLGLTLLAKDEIKDVLIDVLGASDLEQSRQLGRAAVAVLKRVAGELPGAMIDSVWVDRQGAVAWAASLPGPVVEVFCRCDPVVLEQRYRERAVTRDAGNFDAERTTDELWAEEYLRPLGGPWQVIEVETGAEVELDGVVAALRMAD